MRHQVAFRALSRSPSHRNLLLRNLVSSLLEHEQIITTSAKAKEAARVAEKVITWGKKNQRQHKTLANQFLLNAGKTHQKLFTDLRQRYLNRSGGYTRIMPYGHHIGDHAPISILQLVDSPRDLKFASAAAQLGRQLAQFATSESKTLQSVSKAWRAEQEPTASSQPTTPQIVSLLSTLTQRDISKALKFRSNDPKACEEFNMVARDAFDRTMALNDMPLSHPDEEKLDRLRKRNLLRSDGSQFITPPTTGRKLRAGESVSGDVPPLTVAKGAQARRAHK